MSNGPTPLVVEIFNLHVAHPQICASDWRSPLVYRLLGNKVYRDGEKELTDLYTGEGGEPAEGRIALKWKDLAQDFKLRLNTYQEPVLTEHATLGLACILVKERAQMEITEVTRRGERADYWLGDRVMMLEVSGQEDGSLTALAKEKTKQLRENPFNKDGYVCVANYTAAEAWLLFASYKVESDAS